MLKHETIPSSKNFCGGNFQDWLEVMLIDKCNGKCSWCIEKNGYHPKRHVTWIKLARLIIDSDKSNIVLLGGEPTLYKDLHKIIGSVRATTNKNVYLTTNGSMLSPKYAKFTLYMLTGINISIHHYNLEKNRQITGILLEKKNLRDTIKELHKNGVSVRLNCNLIKNHTDSEQEIFSYIDFAKDIKADNVRFAELKNDKNSFVDLTNIFPNQYGINVDPFILGCNSDTEINGMPTNFRQMCGLQTDQRPKPTNPKQYSKIVLYYDGIFYNGWQSKKEKTPMTSKQIRQLLKDVAAGKKTIKQAQMEIERAQIKMEQRLAKEADCGSGCQY